MKFATSRLRIIQNDDTSIVPAWCRIIYPVSIYPGSIIQEVYIQEVYIQEVKWGTPVRRF